MLLDFRAIMNNAALKMCVQVFRQMFSFLTGKYLGVGLLGHVVARRFMF